MRAFESAPSPAAVGYTHRDPCTSERWRSARSATRCAGDRLESSSPPSCAPELEGRRRRHRGRGADANSSTAASACGRRSCIWAGCAVPTTTRRCGQRPASSCCTRSRCCRTTSWTSSRCVVVEPAAHVALRAVASRRGTVRDRRTFRGVGGGAARRSVPGLGRADAAGKRAAASGARRGSGRATTRCAPSWRSGSSRTWSTTPRAIPDAGHRCSTIARRKSGNYTVRRPLEIGAAMAGCDDRTCRGARRLRRARSVRHSSCVTICSESSGRRR